MKNGDTVPEHGTPQPVQIVYAAPPICEEDEIDLFELWEELASQWKTIVAWIVGFVALGSIYIFFTPPQYEGKLIIEPGKMIEKTEERGLIIRNILSPKDLAYSINERFEEKKRKKALKAQVPRSAGGVVEIIYQGYSKEQISDKISEIQQFIELSQQRVINMLKDQGISYIPTRVLVPLKISDEPVKPKRALILVGTGVLGLFIGIMAVFIRRAVKNHKAQKSS